ncbi:MAG TPA: FGGY family carbohydrate kinase [Flavisolibacter sp.]
MEQLPLFLPVLFITTTLITLAIFYRASRSRTAMIFISAWLVLQAILAAVGFYMAPTAMPPRVMFMLAPMLAMIAIILATPWGRRFMDSLDTTSMTWIHAVRVPVELTLFFLYTYGQVPRLMTFEGVNFDMLSGLTAPLAVWLAAGRRPYHTVLFLAWNVLCLVLLFNIVYHGVLSAPTVLQQFAFDQPNVALMYFPYVWLPVFIVPAVLFSHVVLVRNTLRTLRHTQWTLKAGSCSANVSVINSRPVRGHLYISAVMLLLGIDLGTSSVKVSVVDAATRRCLASAQYPDAEADIISPRPGWAEQSPELWWEHVTAAISRCHSSGAYRPGDIGAIGIAYQMHGLVIVDRDDQVLRNAIIWCDGRAVSEGDEACAALGPEHCLSRLLNSPGNFTASKLAWVKKHEPQVYERIHRIMLPGDYIGMKLTGETTTTISALSEAVLWDFRSHALSEDVMEYFGFDHTFIPHINDVFSSHGTLRKVVAEQLSLRPGIPVTYKAGDQLNNAFSLDVLRPGEVAATAGTSGVIYGISDSLHYDVQSRINSFAHVNHTESDPRIGVLLCINGAGISYRWLRGSLGGQSSYEQLNREAAAVPGGAEGLMMLPFGNGPERMLQNRTVGARFTGLDYNLHTRGHLVRATMEGIAHAFRYGLDIMRGNGMKPNIIRAAETNMFRSTVFTEVFANATGVPVALYNTDGGTGAALGAGVGAGCFQDATAALEELHPVLVTEPDNEAFYHEQYLQWRSMLEAAMDGVPSHEALQAHIK